jgi:predicted ATP-dependent Lon-type protease
MVFCDVTGNCDFHLQASQYGSRKFLRKVGASLPRRHLPEDRIHNSRFVFFPKEGHVKTRVEQCQYSRELEYIYRVLQQCTVGKSSFPESGSGSDDCTRESESPVATTLRANINREEKFKRISHVDYNYCHVQGVFRAASISFRRGSQSGVRK